MPRPVAAVAEAVLAAGGQVKPTRFRDRLAVPVSRVLERCSKNTMQLLIKVRSIDFLTC